jgi:transposase
VERQVNQFSREQVDQVYRGVGKEGYDPVTMLKMVLYQLLLGHHSPSTWCAEATRNTSMHWLGRGYRPSRRTWYDFRDRAARFIEELHEQLVGRAIDSGHVDPTTGALDGSSVAACASRHRMVNEETLTKRRAFLEQFMRDEHQDQQGLPRWMPTTPAGCQDLLSRMDRAAEILRQRLEQNAARPSGKRKEPTKVVVSLSDPDAPLGLDKRKTYRPLYTVQKIVDPVSHLTLSYMCEASTGDSGMLAPMIDKTQRIVGGRLETVLADGSYCTILDVADAKQRNIDLIAPVSESGTTRASKSRSGQDQIPREAFRFDAQANCYVCPTGQRLGYKDREKQARSGGRVLYQSRYQADAEKCHACELAERCLGGQGGRMIKRTEGEELLEEQRTKMESTEAKALYKLRGQTVELVFADDKGNRGHDRFHGRGLSRVRAETGLLTLAQNILRLDKLQRTAANPNENTT